MRSLIAGVSALVLIAACSPQAPAKPAAIAPGPTAYADLQKRLIDAKPGDVIEIGEGKFDFTDGLSLDVDNVTIKGAGQGKTILSYAGQTSAGEGLLITSDHVIVSDLTMEDPKGDGIKSKGSDGITFQNVTVEWTGGPKATNGSYGVYPVESKNVLIDGVTVKGASDAGIYVGQSDNIIVRNSRAEFNVAGIEIENSTNADVHDNVATHNAGGILVFDLPDLPKIGGHSTRVFRNQIVENDTQNFAPPGNIVANVPTGTGLMLMANKNVHVFENTFDKNQTTHVMIIAYAYPFKDERYNPLPRDFVIRDNTYGEGGGNPQGRLAPLAPALGGKLPAIVWDGVTKYGEKADKTDEVRIVVREKPEVGFINLGLASTPPDLTKAKPSMDRPADAQIAEPAEVKLPEPAPAKKEGA
jgi:parallel beta-helix repeat protein